MVKLAEVDQVFFGACVEEGKKFSKVAERNICITMAAIDPSKCKGTDPITLYKKKDDVEYVVCSLTPGSLYQQKLNLLFDMGEELNFLTKGNGTVHLTGFYIEEDQTPENPYEMDSDDGEDVDEEEEFDSDMDIMDMDDDEEEEDYESEDEVIVQGKRKKEQKAPEAKKVKFEVELKKPDAKNNQNNQKKNEQQKKDDQKQQQKQQQQKQQQQQQEKKVAESPAGENKKKNKKKNKKNKNKNNKAN